MNYISTALLTKSEYVDMDAHYQIYRTHLKASLERAFSAFVHKNDIFPVSPNEEHDSSLSEADILKLSHAILAQDEIIIRKQLQN